MRGSRTCALFAASSVIKIHSEVEICMIRVLKSFGMAFCCRSPLAIWTRWIGLPNWHNTTSERHGRQNLHIRESDVKFRTLCTFLLRTMKFPLNLTSDIREPQPLMLFNGSNKTQCMCMNLPYSLEQNCTPTTGFNFACTLVKIMNPRH